MKKDNKRLTEENEYLKKRILVLENLLLRVWTRLKDLL